MKADKELRNEGIAKAQPSDNSSSNDGPFRIVGHDFGTPLDDPKALLAELEEQEDIERFRRAER